MSSDLLEEIKAHLKGLGNGSIKPEESACGMCYELAVRFNKVRGAALGSRWPDIHDVGSPYYPVGGPDEFNFNDELWGNTAMGDRRRALCTWLSVNVTEKDLGL